MFRGNWRFLFATLGVIAFAGLVIWGYSFLDRSIEQERADYAHQPARDSIYPHRRVAGEPRSEYYQPNCESPTEREDSDLCAQWSAVEAVNEANGLMRLNLWFGFISLVLTSVGTSLLLWTLWETRNATRRQLRAYMTVQEIDFVHEKDDEGNVLGGHFKVQWKNAGQTPAVHFSSDLNWDLFDGPLPPDFTFPDSSTELGGVMVGPGQIAYTGAPKRFEMTDFAPVHAKEKRAFMWGWVDYTDAFHKRRRVEIAAEMELVLSHKAYTFAYVGISRHNAVDGHCTRKPSPAPPS